MHQRALDTHLLCLIPTYTKTNVFFSFLSSFFVAELFYSWKVVADILFAQFYTILQIVRE